MQAGSNLFAALGLLIERLGERTKDGYQIFVPNRYLRGVSRQATLSEHKAADGVYVRYHPNKVIEGTISHGRPLPSPKTAK